MSDGFGLATILSCLDQGEKLDKLNPKNWMPVPGNRDQSYFASVSASWRLGLKRFDVESLRSYATFNCQEARNKMIEWKMRLDKLSDCGPGAMYMLSQLREYLEWLKPGKQVMREWSEFVLDNVTFIDGPRFDLSEDIDEENRNRVVRVDLKDGDQVFMVRYPKPLKGINLLRECIWIEQQFNIFNQTKGSVQIPCVYADMTPDMKWILGLRNRDHCVIYAQQKILFGMNHTGFAVREETVIATLKGFSPTEQPYILSPNGESFLFWRRRPGVNFPVSLFQFSREDFKDPGDLKKIVE